MTPNLAKLLEEATARPLTHESQDDIGDLGYEGFEFEEVHGANGDLAALAVRGSNARLIALAVNNLGPLVALLERFEAFCEDGTPGEALSPEEAGVRRDTRALLARIEEGAAHA